MRKVFKTVLLLLLLLAVPFQGYAASAMLFCETSHHRTDTVPTTHAGHQHSHDQHTEHDGSLISADHHQHQVADSSDHGSGKNGSHHNLSKCSACSTCCVGAAIAPPLMDFVAVSPSGSHLISFITVSFVGHIPGRLERPPSTFLA